MTLLLEMAAQNLAFTQACRPLHRRAGPARSESAKNPADAANDKTPRTKVHPSLAQQAAIGRIDNAIVDSQAVLVFEKRGGKTNLLRHANRADIFDAQF